MRFPLHGSFLYFLAVNMMQCDVLGCSKILVRILLAVYNRKQEQAISSNVFYKKGHLAHTFR